MQHQISKSMKQNVVRHMLGKSEHCLIFSRILLPTYCSTYQNLAVLITVRHNADELEIDKDDVASPYGMLRSPRQVLNFFIPPESFVE